MRYRFVVLNKSMNPVIVSRVVVYSHEQFLDVMKRQLEVFWRYKCQDSESSFRLIPDEDRTLDMFKENEDNPIF